MSSIMLIIHRHDTLKPLDIQFKLFANKVHETKYHKRCTHYTSREG